MVHIQNACILAQVTEVVEEKHVSLRNMSTNAINGMSTQQTQPRRNWQKNQNASIKAVSTLALCALHSLPICCVALHCVGCIGWKPGLKAKLHWFT